MESFASILFCGLIIFVIERAITKKEREYLKSDYYKQTNIEWNIIKNDLGKLGEYYTFEILNEIETPKYLLLNTYIPKDCLNKTEIDIIMIHESGFYIIESKNYSGWIFGKLNSSKWTQTLPTNDGINKEHFYNPIHQNINHIKYLKRFLNLTNEIPFYSFIVFSNRCELKDIPESSTLIKILQRQNLKEEINKTIQNSKIKIPDYEMKKLYEILLTMSNVTEQDKANHINTINKLK